MNLGQLRTSLQAKGYGTDTATSQTEALNAVLRRVSGLHQWPWLEVQSTAVTCVIGTPSYTLTAVSATLLHVQAVRIEKGTEYPEINYLPPQEFRTKEHGDRNNEVPLYWTRIDETIRLYPRPDKAYTLIVDYIVEVTALTGDTDSPTFDAPYHDVLVWGAISDMAFRQRDWAAHQQANQQYDRRLAEMERAYGVRQRQGNSRVRRSSFWGQVGRV